MARASTDIPRCPRRSWRPRAPPTARSSTGSQRSARGSAARTARLLLRPGRPRLVRHGRADHGRASGGAGVGADPWPSAGLDTTRARPRGAGARRRRPWAAAAAPGRPRGRPTSGTWRACAAPPTPRAGRARGGVLVRRPSGRRSRAGAISATATRCCSRRPRARCTRPRCSREWALAGVGVPGAGG